MSYPSFNYNYNRIFSAVIFSYATIINLYGAKAGNPDHIWPDKPLLTKFAIRQIFDSGIW